VTEHTSRICVTGASGFIAAHIVRELLERGYGVRGTVRKSGSPGKLAFLSALRGATERLELVQADLLDPSSLDEAIAGCDIVIHAASPFVLDVKDVQRDLVRPAVDGTLNVLRSARSARVKRVVLTSSVAAVSDEPIAGKVFTEEDWNQRSSLTRNPYYYSKALAERAAWEFRRDGDFELVAINPATVIGPSLGPAVNTSNAIVRDILRGGFPGILALSWCFVDVRDVADAHVLAMENPYANGRYICASETLTMKEVVKVLGEAGYGAGYRLPRLDLTSPLANAAVWLMSYTRPAGTGSFVRTNLGRAIRFDSSRIRQDLGVEFRPVRESVLATAEDLIRQGHVRRAA
jgi:dihydroflavonol-4-reductase